MDAKNWKYIKKLPSYDQDLIEEILSLKKEKNVFILAHTYQIEPIQLIADVLGDHAIRIQDGGWGRRATRRVQLLDHGALLLRYHRCLFRLFDLLYTEEDPVTTPEHP